jgi:hypothetical protein
VERELELEESIVDMDNGSGAKVNAFLVLCNASIGCVWLC